jgi:hypothetical protein
MAVPTADVVNAYTALLERVIINWRLRLRYGEVVSSDESHDLLDALHNVPIMLRNYGGWHVEENVLADLSRYDERWLNVPDSDLRISLLETLRRVRAREFDH